MGELHHGAGVATKIHGIAPQVGRLQKERQRHLEDIRHLIGSGIERGIGGHARYDRRHAKSTDGFEGVEIPNGRNKYRIETDFFLRFAQGGVHGILVVRIHAATGERHLPGMRLQVICREDEAEAWEAADQLVRHATERQKQEMKTLYNKSEANRRVQELAREHGDLLLPHLWTGITKVRPGAGIAVVGNPTQCAETLQQFIDAGCHSFCLSGYLHDEEAERFGRLIRPILAENNRGRLAA